jgi:hypothetical protein
MYILTMAFGDRWDYHAHASLLIISLLRELDAGDRIIVVTDRADLYSAINEKVLIETVDTDTLSEWMGQHQFVWRTKIKAIDHVLDKYGDTDILYLDSDILYIRDIEKVKESAAANQFMMHKNEGRLSAGKTRTFELMWQKLRNNTFGGLRVADDVCMWNAGVLLLPASFARDVNAATLKACDELCDRLPMIQLAEQFAYSHVLSHFGTIRPAEREFLHYWGNKSEWCERTSTYLAESFLSGKSLSDCAEQFDPRDFLDIPVYRKRSKLLSRIDRSLARIFKTTELRFEDEASKYVQP